MLRTLRCRHLIAAFAQLLFAAAVFADPTITFSNHRVVVANVPARSEVVVVGIGRSSLSGIPFLTRFVKLQKDEDGDGVVTFAPDTLPATSVWTAAVVDSGSYAIVRADGRPIVAIAAPEDFLRPGNPQLSFDRNRIHVFVVRPRAGVWADFVADGGAYDADGKMDGRLRVTLAHMTGIAGNAERGPVLTPRDLFIAVDPRTLDVLVREVR